MELPRFICNHVADIDRREDSRHENPVEGREGYNHADQYWNQSSLAHSSLATHGLSMTGQLSAPWHRALFALSIGAILAYGAAFAWYMLANLNLVNLLRDVNGDDSFYYFQIARNLAEGKFSTFDGGITQTNGYHPLWMLSR